MFRHRPCTSWGTYHADQHRAGLGNVQERFAVSQAAQDSHQAIGNLFCVPYLQICMVDLLQWWRLECTCNKSVNGLAWAINSIIPFTKVIFNLLLVMVHSCSIFVCCLWSYQMLFVLWICWDSSCIILNDPGFLACLLITCSISFIKYIVCVSSLCSSNLFIHWLCVELSFYIIL